MKNTIEIKRWDNNEVIFSHTCEDNTIRKTIKEAVNQHINLSYADLRSLDLSNIDLSNVNLDHARLLWSNLKNINLTGANLNNVYLDYTNISHEQLINAKGINDQCPKEGSFIGWKKCCDRDYKSFVVKLEIPADAKRSSATTNKCRCSKAKVMEIQNINGTKADIDEVYSFFNPYFSYKIGEIVKSDSFNERYWIECGYGIHFFMRRIDAAGYNFF